MGLGVYFLAAARSCVVGRGNRRSREVRVNSAWKNGTNERKHPKAKGRDPFST